MSRWIGIMVDLDGTLCDASHRIHHLETKPKNWDAFCSAMCDDEIMGAVATVVSMVRNWGFKIAYCTGRPDNYRQDTERWLSEHGQLEQSSLHMRRAGDYRPDDIVKLEIYKAEIEPLYDIRFVLEDRSRVVAMWRSIGLTCFQVADGNF